MGRYDELARRAYETFLTEGADAWIERFATPDFVWDMTPMGLGRYDGPEAFRAFFDEWISSFGHWSMEPAEPEEIGDGVVVTAVRQGGTMHGSEHSVELRFAQLGVWEGARLKRMVNYPELEEARSAAAELVAGG